MKVIRSIHDADGRLCIDILRRSDGRLAYKEFRRDVEDRGRWFVINDFSDRSFADELALLNDARKEIRWLAPTTAISAFGLQEAPRKCLAQK